MPKKNDASKKNAFIGIAVVFLVFLFSSLWIFYFQYSGAESKLEDQLATVQLAQDYELQSTIYTHGTCADECPTLEVTYEVTGSREEVGQTTRQAFENAGFDVTYNSGRIIARKDRIYVSSETIPELADDVEEYGEDEQNEPVNTLILDFSYR